MRRRDFNALIGAAVLWPLAARAQQPAKIPTIGFLGPASPENWATWTKAFVDRLAELGWIDGRSATIVYRWGRGHIERFGPLAAELVALKADIILTAGSATLQTMKEASQTPIVFALASDPVATGMVKSLARPGGNVTGLSLVAPELAGKRLGLLQAALPNIKRVGVLVDVAYPASVLELGQVKDAITAGGLEFVPIEVRSAEDIESALAGIVGRADALYVCSADPLMNNTRDRINALALAAKMPTLYGEKPYAEAGGLISYGPAVPTMFRRAAEIVDKILKGAKPADIPVEQPTSFDLVINLKTAKALGLSIPQTLLATADEVIE
ncbi:MAG TPA: ABC transporter substrate-binding protein [Xanthobacteraceae bacterium]|jgi:putative ABC transport system substrate-binding protein|nr:ABC transporter substrate-binding protein [Xanthobacteraceae bacterium]